MCLLKNKSGSVKEETFSDYLTDFFKESSKKDDSERSEVGIQIDSGFLLNVLRELKEMNDGVLLVGTL
jgi:hypothetical protein